MVLGTIATELEVEYLLAPPSSVVGNLKLGNGDNETSSFVHALREGILFCHSLGMRERDGHALTIQMPYDHREPLAHLLPCVMSLISNGTPNKEEEKSKDGMRLALATLCEDDCLLRAVSQFLRRASKEWNDHLEGARKLPRVHDAAEQQFDGLISLVEMSALVIDELTAIARSSGGKVPQPAPEVRRELRLALEVWKNILTGGAREWQSQKIVGSNAARAASQVLQSLTTLRSQRGDATE